MARKKSSPWFVGILIRKTNGVLNHLVDFYKDFNQTTENTLFKVNILFKQK